MLDNQIDPAVSTPSSDGQTQPGDFKVPDGYEMLSADDAARLRRYEQEVTGFKPLRDSLSKYGLGSQEAVSEWSPFFETVNKHKYTPKELMSIFSDNPAGAGGNSQQSQQAPVDGKAIRDEIMAEVRKDRATADHSVASKAEEQLLAEAVSKVAAGGDPDLVGAWFREKAAAARKAYSDDHPLKGTLSPLDKTGIDGVVKQWQDKTAKSKGAQMNSTATRANKPIPGVAGNSTPGGKPSSAGDTRSMDEKLADKLERIQAASRNGRVVSTV